MRLSLAIALILLELGAGVLLFTCLVPVGEVRKSYFTFHSLLGAVCLALAGLISSNPALWIAMALCFAAFGAAGIDKPRLSRACQVLAALTVIVFCLLRSAGNETLGSATDPAIHAATFWRIGTGIGVLLGTALLGATHHSMALGHWYLISRNLSFSHLIRLTKVLGVLIVARAVYVAVFILALRHVDPVFGERFQSQLFSADGNLVFFLMRVLWGILLPMILAVMAWRCAVGKANQAATGLLYLCEVSVLFGELFAAYLMV